VHRFIIIKNHVWMLQIFWLSTYSTIIYKGESDKNNIGEAPSAKRQAPCSAL
jgi:hypothetical protein